MSYAIKKFSSMITQKPAGEFITTFNKLRDAVFAELNHHEQVRQC